MRRPVPLPLALLALPFAALPLAAFAQDLVEGAYDSFWTTLTTPKGCIAFESQLFNLTHNEPKAIATWSGACRAGQPISGGGTLTLKRPLNGLDTVRNYKGKLVGGYFDGKVIIQDALSSPTDPAIHATGSPHTYTYTMGCKLNELGKPETGTEGKQKQIRCRPKTAGVAPPNSH